MATEPRDGGTIVVDPAIQRRGQLGCGQIEIVERQRCGPAKRQAAIEADIAARKIADGIVAEALRDALHLRVQPPRRAAADAEIDPRACIDRADIVERQIGNIERPAHLGQPGRQIAVEREATLQAGEAHGQVVRQDAVAGVHQRAIQRAVVEARIEQLVAADDAANAGRYRDGEARAVVGKRSFLHHVVHRDAARIDLRHAQHVRHAQLAERTIERCLDLRAVQRDVFREQRRIEQLRGYRDSVEAVFGEIDRTRAVRIHAAPAQSEFAFENAAFELAHGRQLHIATQSAGGEPFQIGARIGTPDDAIGAALVVDVEIGDASIALHRVERAFPGGPGAVAFQLDGEIVVRADHAGQESTLGSAPVQIEIEAVAVRLGIDQRGEYVAPAEGTVGIQMHQSVANIRLGCEIDDPLFPDQAIGDRQVLDCEAVHADVEIRQQRRVRIAGIELGKRVERAAGQHEMAHVEPAGEPSVRPPIEIDPRHFQEQRVVGIAELHVVQSGAPQHRPVDLSDLDLEPGRGRDLGDFVDDELAAGRRVQESDGKQQHAHHGGHQPADNAQRNAERATALLRFGRRRAVLLHLDDVALRFAHQKAWPSET